MLHGLHQANHDVISHTVFGFLEDMSSIFNPVTATFAIRASLPIRMLALDTLSRRWSMIQSKADLVQSVMDEARLVTRPVRLMSI